MCKMASNEIIVSFCITCKGRLNHLMQTLPENIRQNNNFSGVEFVLLNYSSPDNLDTWVKSNMSFAIHSGILMYYKTMGYDYYMPSHAKNVAHRLARGKIACNLDADNFTGPDFSEFLANLFSNNTNVFFQPTTGEEGTAGRIAMLKKDFERLGGYDERMQLGWGQDDRDLAKRATAVGLRPIDLPTGSAYAHTLYHDDVERTRFTRVFSKKHSQEVHTQLSRDSIAKQEFVANRGKKWGAAKVEMNFNACFEI
jgi:hypothetical protein